MGTDTRFSAMIVQMSKAEIDAINTILRKVPSVERAALFGSRALRKAKNGSEVDIVLYGSVNDDDVSSVHMALEEETYLPYFFDILSYDAIESPALIEHIDDYGMIIFEREE